MAENKKSIPDFVLPPSVSEVQRRQDAAIPQQQSSVPDFVLPPSSAEQQRIQSGTPVERSLAGDVAMSAGSGLARGVTGLPGIIGDVQSLLNLGASKIVPKFTGEDPSKLYERLETGLLQFPRSKTLIESAERFAPPIKEYTQYSPQTGAGRIAKETLEALPSAYVAPGSMTQRTLSGVLGGAGAGSLGELARGSEYETAAKIAGGVLGSVAGSAVGAGVKARSAPAVTERAERIAGQALRESSPVPSRTIQQLEAEVAERAADPARYVSGVEPTTAQIIREPGFANVERQVSALSPGTAQAAALADQKLANKAALGAEAAGAPAMVAGAIPSVDLKAAFSFPGPNPQNIASQNVRRAVDAVEQSLDSAQKAAWQNPLLQKANYYTQKSVGSINDYIDNLNLTQKGALNPNVMANLRSYAESGQKTIPLDALQSIRSAVLDDAREAIRKGRSTDWFINNELGKHIAKVMNEASNIQFGDKTGQSRKAWQDAVASTKQYYDTFRPDFMKKMVAETKGGAPAVPGNVVFEEMFKGSKAAQNFDEAYRVLGPQLHDDASTWILGKLTNNGRDLAITSSDATRFLANPNNAAIVSKIPGLQNRINDLVVKTGESLREAQLRNINSAFQTAASSDNPRILANFLAKNGSVIKSTLPPDGQKFIDSLQRSARVLDTMPVGAVPNTKTLDMLSNNSIGGILYGRALGRIPDMMSGELINYILGKSAGISAPGAGAILAATGVGRQVSSGLANTFTNMMFGTTKQQTVDLLQQAMRDPQLAAVLMQKPTASNINGIVDAIGKSLSATERTVERAVPVAAGQVEPFEPRQERKAGGRVMSAQNMLAAAERAKRDISGKTKVLLNSSDDHVAKALEIANQNLEG